MDIYIYPASCTPHSITPWRSEKCTPQSPYEPVYDNACPASESECATVTSSTSASNRTEPARPSLSNMSSPHPVPLPSPPKFRSQAVSDRIRDIGRLQTALADLCRTLGGLSNTLHDREALTDGERDDLQDRLLEALSVCGRVLALIKCEPHINEAPLLPFLAEGEDEVLFVITMLSIAESWIAIGEQRALERHPQSRTVAACRLQRAQARFRLFKVLNALGSPRLMILSERRETLFPQEPVEEDEATMVRDFFQITIDHPQGHMCPICHADLDADPDNEQEQEEEEERDEAVGHRGHRAVTTPCCNQWFHVSCLLQWRLDHATCPMCRGVLEEAFAHEMIERRIAELATL